MELVTPYVPPKQFFVEMDAVKRIRDGITCAIAFGEPVQVISDAGFGKTTALYYLAEEMRGVYCQAGQSHKNVPDMYRMLLEAFGISHDAKYTRDLFGVLIRALRQDSWDLERRGRQLLIVDEIQTMEATAQRELLNIQETCNLALVISGNGERLAKARTDQGAWKQIDSRITMRIKLPSLSRQDCDLLGAAYGVEGMEAYEAIANFGMRTTARQLGRLLKEARSLTTATGGIRLEHIWTVLRAKPDFADLKLLKSISA